MRQRTSHLSVHVALGYNFDFSRSLALSDITKLEKN